MAKFTESAVANATFVWLGCSIADDLNIAPHAVSSERSHGTDALLPTLPPGKVRVGEPGTAEAVA